MAEPEVEDARFRSRKWILFLGVEIIATVGATLLTACHLFGVERAPDASSILNWWTMVTGGVLGGYGTVNLIGKSVKGE